jgi:tRNA1(Val) A37 N6-methylase TrmN6
VAPRVENALELGSGIGTIGMILGWKWPKSNWVTIEAQKESYDLALRSAELNGLSDRFDQRQGDFREVDLSPKKFDLIVGSPPYFPLGTGILGDHPQKIACRFEVRGAVDAYLKKAAQHLAAGGVFCCVFPVDPEEQRQRIFQGGNEAGLVCIRSRDVFFREGEPMALGLFAWMLPDSVPPHLRNKPWIESPLYIRSKLGEVTDEYLRLKLAIGFPPTR